MKTSKLTLKGLLQTLDQSITNCGYEDGHYWYERKTKGIGYVNSTDIDDVIKWLEDDKNAAEMKFTTIIIE